MFSVKKVLALLLALAMALSVMACAAKPAAETPAAPGAEAAAPEHKGTIMWLSNLSSGLQYETTMAYSQAICQELGYDFTVVYGDGYNDAAGNLNAVRNGMTDDVVAIMASQDGGIASIMEEFPNVYVCGYNTDMRSVFGGENAACLENDHFLGTICDGYADGAMHGKDIFDAVVRLGFKKVSTVLFPAFAYPSLTVSDQTFRALVEEYNATAADADKIEVVGEPLVLEFQPLPDSYFLEEGNADLDCIVALCAGVLFVYPTLISAKANGTCSADTKMITGGFDDDENIVKDIGEAGTIARVAFSPAEDPAYALILIDNAVNGCQYDDFEIACVDGYCYDIDSKEDIDNVMTKSMAGTGDITLAQLSIEEVKNLCRRFNPEATFAALYDAFHGDHISVDALKNR